MSDPNTQAITIEFTADEALLDAQIGNISTQLDRISSQITDAMATIGRYVPSIGESLSAVFAETDYGLQKISAGLESNNEYAKAFISVGHDRLRMQQAELAQLETIVEFNKLSGESLDEQYEAAVRLTEQINALVDEYRDGGKLSEDVRKQLLAMQLSAAKLTDELSESVTPSNMLNSLFESIGLKGIGGAVTRMSSLAAWIGAGIELTKTFLLQLSEWTSRNYALYGTLAQVAQGVRDVGLANQITQEEAEKATKALMDVAIDPTDLRELAGTVGLIASESKMSIEPLAELTKKLEVMGLTNKQVSETLGLALAAQTEFALTSEDAANAIGLLNKNAYDLEARFGADGVRKFSEELLTMAGNAKQAGMDMGDFYAIQQQLMDDPSNLAAVMSVTFDPDDDPAEMMQKVMARAQEVVDTSTPDGARAFAGRIAKEFGASLGALQGLAHANDELANSTAKLNGIDAISAANRRRQQDVLYQLKVLWDNYVGSLLSALNTVFGPLSGALARITFILNQLDPAAKQVLAVAVTLAAAFVSWQLAGAAIVPVLSTIGTALGAVAGAISLPVVAIGALIALLTYLTIKFNLVQEYMSGFISIVKPAWDDLVKALEPVIPVLDEIGAAFSSFGKSQYLSDMLSGLGVILAMNFKLVGSIVGGVVSGIIDSITTIINAVTAVSSAVMTLYGWVTGSVSTADMLAASWKSVVSVFKVLLNPLRVVWNLFKAGIDLISEMDWLLTGNSLVPSVELLGVAFEGASKIMRAVVLPIMDTVNKAIAAVENTIVSVSNNVVKLARIGPGQLMQTGAGLVSVAGGITAIGVAFAGASIGAAAFAAMSRLSSGKGVVGILRDMIETYSFEDLDLAAALDNVRSVSEFMDNLGNALVDLTKSNLVADANRAYEWFKGLFGGSDTPFAGLKSSIFNMNAAISEIMGGFIYHFKDLDLGQMVEKMEFINKFVLQYRSLADQMGRIDIDTDKMENMRDLMDSVRGDAIVTVKSDLQDQEANARGNAMLGSLITKISELTEVVRAKEVGRDIGEQADSIVSLLRQYLPEVAEASEGGLVGTSSQWR